ncbi:hypothetical protein [Micromonospora sp. NBC_01638]|uniref:hypothetical protein n=1 Tax=Micromonospora sp. NBC_01638 TaxID=2975982 RepID=UPI003866EE9B|nr:hypothetical protein OG811_20620 [Micromonospora sp. NBC_01638]
MRNKLNWLGGFLLWLLFGFMMLMFSLNSANGRGGLIAVASFFAVICYLISLTTMFSFVKPTRESLQIVNPGARVIVPWGRVKGVDAENGLVVSAIGHRDVACYAFQGSLLGKLWGSRRNAGAAEAIEAWRKKNADRVSGGEIHSEVPWVRHLLWFAVGWSVLAGGIPVLARLLQP